MRIDRILHVIATTLILAGLPTVSSNGQIPRIISYQGVAYDASGSLIEDGEHEIRVALYETSDGPNEIFSQVLSVESVDGLFSVQIGPIDAEILFDRPYWIGITIDEGSELQPRTQLTSSPYALNSVRSRFAVRSATARYSDTSGVAESLGAGVDVVRSVNGASGDLQIQGEGATMVSLDGSTITISTDSTGSGGTGDAWLLSGNAATVPGTDFLGTTDNLPFEIHVDEQGHTGDATSGRGRVLRFEPRGGSPNLIGGFHENGTTANVGGVTIAGGGEFGGPNLVGGNFSTVSGGRNNNAVVLNTVIGGGSNNTASGEGATIAGGFANSAEDDGASIGGGRRNEAKGWNATVAGGSQNLAAHRGAAVGGGEKNSATGTGVTIGGGVSNLAFGNYGTIGGGDGNATSNEWSTVGGGRFNNASSRAAVVAGGARDTASGSYAAVSGGSANHASGAYSFIGSGQSNIASGTSSVVAGGTNNEANGDFTSVVGGYGLSLDGKESFGFLGSNSQDDRKMDVSLDNVALFGNVDVLVGSNDSTTRQLRLYMAQETTGTFPELNTYYSSFESGAQFGTYEYILPLRGGSAGDVLTIASVQGKRIQLEWQSNNGTDNDDERELTQSHDANVQDQLARLLQQAKDLERKQAELSRKIEALKAEVEPGSTDRLMK